MPGRLAEHGDEKAQEIRLGQLVGTIDQDYEVPGIGSVSVPVAQAVHQRVPVVAEVPGDDSSRAKAANSDAGCVSSRPSNLATLPPCVCSLASSPVSHGSSARVTTTHGDWRSVRVRALMPMILAGGRAGGRGARLDCACRGRAQLAAVEYAPPGAHRKLDKRNRLPSRWSSDRTGGVPFSHGASRWLSSQRPTSALRSSVHRVQNDPESRIAVCPEGPRSTPT
jgi:hypothetical protein